MTALDSAGGDGDLGVVMRDGFRIADEFVTDSDEHDIGKMIYMAGKKFNSIASSSMGTLISSGFMKIGKQLKGKDDKAGLLLYPRDDCVFFVMFG